MLNMTNERLYRPHIFIVNSRFAGAEYVVQLAHTIIFDVRNESGDFHINESSTEEDMAVQMLLVSL